MKDKTYIFDIQIFDKHLIIENQNNIILVDTGSPVTLHDAPLLNFCERDFPSASKNQLTSIDEISSLLGKKITTLLGIDVLSKFNCIFDYRKAKLTLSEDKIPFEGESIRFTQISGIPVLEFHVFDQKSRFFLDTGAKISYLNSDLTKHLLSKSTQSDFYPGIGPFETPCFEIITQFGQHRFNVLYGNLPKMMESMLESNQINGIIGFDFFNNFRVMIDFENQVLKVGL